MYPAADVTNKRILITGGASGIGAASALLLASRGAKVMIADVAEEQAMATVKQAQEQGYTIYFYKLDVANANDVSAGFDEALSTLGGLDVVVNNAGIDHTPGPLHEISDDDFDRNIAVNLKGVWHCMRAAIKSMVEHGGHVINVASVAGLRAAPSLSAYSASKHGVIGLTKSAAIEYARVNLRFNAVCPSFIDTPMVQNTLKKLDERSQNAIIKASPLKRLGTAHEVAHAIAWLASDESSFMNGHSLALDGGMSA